MFARGSQSLAGAAVSSGDAVDSEGVGDVSSL
jgi:hypothetical protein